SAACPSLEGFGGRSCRPWFQNSSREEQPSDTQAIIESAIQPRHRLAHERTGSCELDADSKKREAITERHTTISLWHDEFLTWCPVCLEICHAYNMPTGLLLEVQQYDCNAALGSTMQ